MIGRARHSTTAALRGTCCGALGSWGDPSDGLFVERPGDLLGLLGRRGAHWLGLVAVLVPSASEAIELARCPLGGRLVEDRAQVAAERLMLAGPVGRSEAVRR